MNPTLQFLRLCALSTPLALGMPPADAQTFPAERVGVAPKEMAAVKLPSDFSMSKGRVLRMREVTIAPGGFLPMHSHADRPAVSYLIKGTLTEYLNDGAEVRQFTAGQSYATHGAVSHALQNKGDEPVVFIEVDLP